MKTGAARAGDDVDLPAAAATGFSRKQAAQNLEFTDGINVRIRLDRDIRPAIGNVGAIHGESILTASCAIDRNVNGVGLTARIGGAHVDLVSEVIGHDG